MLVLDHGVAHAPEAPEAALPVLDGVEGVGEVAVEVLVVDVTVDTVGVLLDAVAEPETGVHKAVVLGFQPVAAQLTWLTRARYRRPSWLTTVPAA
jgi:hypothetical protein